MCEGLIPRGGRPGIDSHPGIFYRMRLLSSVLHIKQMWPQNVAKKICIAAADSPEELPVSSKSMFPRWRTPATTLKRSSFSVSFRPIFFMATHILLKSPWSSSRGSLRGPAFTCWKTHARVRNSTRGSGWKIQVIHSNRKNSNASTSSSTQQAWCIMQQQLYFAPLE